MATQLQVTRVSAQVAGNLTTGALRVTRVSAQVAGAVTDGALRVTRTAASVAGQVAASDSIQVSRLLLQVATTSTVEQPALTSELGTGFSSLGVTSMTLGLPPQFEQGTVKSFTATSTINFAQSASDSGTANFRYTAALGTPDSVLGESMVTGFDELRLYTSELALAKSNESFGTISLKGANALSPVVALTSVPGIENSVPGRSLTLGYPAAISDPALDVTASSTITFTTTTADVEKFKPLSASHTITFTQTGDRAGSFSPTASSSITFSQANAVAGPVPVTASSALSLTQGATSGLLTRTAGNAITFSQSGVFGQTLELTASSVLSLTQGAASGLLTRTAGNSITFEQLALQGTVLASGIARTASDTLTFVQTNNRYILKASALTLTASDVLTMSQRAIFPIALTASNTLTLAQSADGNPGKSATQVLELTQTVVANHWRSLTASNTFNVQHGFTWLQFRNGVPIPGGLGGCDITKQYSPQSGGDLRSGGPALPAIRAIPPDLEQKNDVIFYSPANVAICNATTSITLRTPNFGDRESTSYNRINRESRGGSLTIFRDPAWPSEQKLLMDFSGLKDAEIETILIFLEDTLGQLISFRDWNGRIWTGIIVTPDAAITKQGTNLNDISIEMEVQDTALNLAACSVINFTQSNVVVKVPA